MKLHDLPRIARTLRPLRASQLVWRGRYAVQRRFPPPRITLPVAYDEQELRHAVSPERFPTVPLFHRPGPSSRDVVRQLSACELRQLNLTLPFNPASPDWRLGGVKQHRLWTITLHYQGWAHALAEVIAGRGPEAPQAESLFLTLLNDWMTRCDLAVPGARDLAWNSFAISTRIGWWIRSYFLLGKEWWNSHCEFHGRFLASLWRQAEFLYGHPEWDLRGNHILRNAVGLAWIGRFFTGERPKRWRAAATAIALDQAAEQVLPDGGHFERSPMYHVHIMEDIASLALLLDEAEARAEMASCWSGMAECLAWLRHPDGEVPLFNDGAQKAVMSPAAMLRLAPQLRTDVDPQPRQGGRYLSDFGLCVFHGAPWSLFFDVGQIGADCQPGHAHADSLSLECSWRGRRLFIDPGTHSYDLDPLRAANRSTASHNTVCLDGQDSSEVWHIFRVGRRAKPIDVRVHYTPDELIAETGHDGYDVLPGSPRHRRQLRVGNDGVLQITDRITGGRTHKSCGGWLLGPKWTATADSQGWLVSDGQQKLRVAIKASSPITHSIEPAICHPEYGVSLETQRLVWNHEGPLPLEVTTTVHEFKGE